MITERRKFKRYATDTEKTQAIVPAGQSKCSIRDISQGGMLIEYSPVSDISLETAQIDIIAMKHEQVFLPKVTCETVYDIPTLSQDKSFSGGLLRLRGLKFIGLTPKQEDTLGLLIDECKHGN